MTQALHLPLEIRQVLWQNQDWCQLFVNKLKNISSDAENVAAWAQAAEAIVPDRSVAIRFYRKAWEIDSKLPWIRRARVMALECADFQSVAELAGMEFEKTKAPNLLFIQGIAYLDAGQQERAIVFLQKVLELKPKRIDVKHLLDGASGNVALLPEGITLLEKKAIGASSSSHSCDFLLLAARLSRLLGNREETESLLSQAFHLNPGNNAVFSLLENLWIVDKNWSRLSELYRLRTDYLHSVEGDEIDLYRRAGTRLASGNVCPGLGVRILEQGVKVVYQRELEGVSFLLAMLRLLIQQMVDSGAKSSAIRLLAQALAHPRTDDEVMWIATTGIDLAADDETMHRTSSTFKILQERLLKEHAKLEVGTVVAEAKPEEEPLEWLEAEDLEVIGEELDERSQTTSTSAERGRVPTAPKSDIRKITQTFSMVANVNIRVQARWAHNDRLFQAITRDLSIKGLLLSCSVPLMLGDEIYFTLLMPGEGAWDFKEHKVNGVVLGTNGSGEHKIRFMEISEEYKADLLALIAKHDADN